MARGPSCEKMAGTSPAATFGTSHRLDGEPPSRYLHHAPLSERKAYDGEPAPGKAEVWHASACAPTPPAADRASPLAFLLRFPGASLPALSPAPAPESPSAFLGQVVQEPRRAGRKAPAAARPGCCCGWSFRHYCRFRAEAGCYTALYGCPWTLSPWVVEGAAELDTPSRPPCLGPETRAGMRRIGKDLWRELTLR